MSCPRMWSASWQRRQGGPWASTAAGRTGPRLPRLLGEAFAHPSLETGDLLSRPRLVARHAAVRDGLENAVGILLNLVVAAQVEQDVMACMSLSRNRGRMSLAKLAMRVPRSGRAMWDAVRRALLERVAPAAAHHHPATTPDSLRRPRLAGSGGQRGRHSRRPASRFAAEADVLGWRRSSTPAPRQTGQVHSTTPNSGGLAAGLRTGVRESGVRLPCTRKRLSTAGP